uniref:Uncharacterized protein n=1 Tax=Knipowitschia caucasica TaxID=637954 RepID=A0AAV2LC05_KNICA
MEGPEAARRPSGQCAEGRGVRRREGRGEVHKSSSALDLSADRPQRGGGDAIATVMPLRWAMLSFKLACMIPTTDG